MRPAYSGLGSVKALLSFVADMLGPAASQLNQGKNLMAGLIFPARPSPTLPVLGQGNMPIGRIFCVGRNYAAHAAEMGGTVDRSAPFYFTKAAHALLPSGQDMPYPSRTQDLHHEMELVVALGKGGRDVAEADALDLVLGYGCGLDMTRRDLQAAAKDKRRPWDTSKDFDNAAIIGAITPADQVGGLGPRRIALKVNGVIRQEAQLREMVWSVPEIIADLSRLYELHPGDVIMMGTPAGVAAVVPGDKLVGVIDGMGAVKTTIR